MEYSIERHKHGFLIRGGVELSDFTAIEAMARAAGYDQIDTGVAAAAQATLALTNKASGKAWRMELNRGARKAADGDRELAWLKGTDTGISSQTIFSVLSEKHGAYALSNRWGPDTPSDPSDFGRCYRLLKLLGWRNRLPEVAAKYPAWAPLVREWDRLTALYEEEYASGMAPKLYAEMQTLLKEAGRR